MSEEQKKLIDALRSVSVWKKRSIRAPHKPLLLLHALAAVQRGESRLMQYDYIHQQLDQLLRDFGPPRRLIHPEYPFWRLQNDGDFWEIPERKEAIEMRGPRLRTGDVPPSVLRSVKAHGGFSRDAHRILSNDPFLVNDLVTLILGEHFPPSYHEDLLNSIGMPAIEEGRKASERDPKFRADVIRLYEHKCAMCGFDGQLGFSDLALEAAHIMWHAQGGPDEPRNGLLLCSIHHKVFDRGAVGLTDDCRIVVSQHLHGGVRVSEMITKLAGDHLRKPIDRRMRPAREYIEWHRKEVFQPPARSMT